MSVPKFLQPYLASYDLNQLNVKKDKKLIIREVLNKGNYKALTWLGKTYSRKELKEVIASPTRGMWMRSVLSYWLQIFNIRLPKKTFEEAILNLNPRE